MGNLVTDRQFNLLVNHLDAPFKEKVTVSSALQWLRDEKGIACAAHPTYYQSRERLEVWYMYSYFSAYTNQRVNVIKSTKKYNTYPLAESALLTAVLNYLIENK